MNEGGCCGALIMRAKTTQILRGRSRASGEVEGTLGDGYDSTM